MQKIIDAEKSDLFDVLAYVAACTPNHQRAGLVAASHQRF